MYIFIYLVFEIRSLRNCWTKLSSHENQNFDTEWLNKVHSHMQCSSPTSIYNHVRLMKYHQKSNSSHAVKITFHKRFICSLFSLTISYSLCVNSSLQLSEAPHCLKCEDSACEWVVEIFLVQIAFFFIKHHFDSIYERHISIIKQSCLRNGNMLMFVKHQEYF